MFKRWPLALVFGLAMAACEDPPPGSTATPTEASVDADGDGWTLKEGDCDDTDAAINPGATEICDDKDRDENCNGLADNADPNSSTATRTRYFHDVDRDSFGDPNSSKLVCDDPSTSEDWWSTNADDCNDREPRVNPDARDLCNDIDDNCDGQVDNNAACGLPTPPETPTEDQTGKTPTETPEPRTPFQPRTPRPTPTPVPTPTQVPPPQDAWHGFTRFAIAPRDQGLDYDSDGSPDNAIYAALEVVQSELTALVNNSIDAMTDFPDQEDACEAQPEGCTFTPGTAIAAKATVAVLIEDVVSVESINTALESTFELATTPWAIELYTVNRSTELRYFAGSVQAIDGVYGFKAERYIGLQSGFLRTDGQISEFGPGSFFITVVLEDEQGGEPSSIGFEVQEALTRFVFGDTRIDGALTGGGVEIVALVNIVESLITTFDEAGLLPPDFDAEATIEATEQALTGACDIVCASTGNPCFSVSFTYDTQFLTTVYPL